MVGVFPNEGSASTLATEIALRGSDEWALKCYLTMNVLAPVEESNPIIRDVDGARFITRGPSSGWWTSLSARSSSADLRAIFASTDGGQALGIAAAAAEKWHQKGHEKVAEHLEEHDVT